MARQEKGWCKKSDFENSTTITPCHFLQTFPPQTTLDRLDYNKAPYLWEPATALDLLHDAAGVFEKAAAPEFCTTAQAAVIVGKSKEQVHQYARKHGIGQMAGKQRVFSANDIETLRKIAGVARAGNPNWRKQ